MHDDFEILRQRRAFPRPTPAPPGSGGSAAFVGKVTTAAPAVGKFCLVNPVVVTGTEGEGNAGTLTVDTGTSIKVYIIGPKAPVTNDTVICNAVDYRWVTGITKPASCAGTITVTVKDCHGTVLPGATVTIVLGGVTVSSGTTDGSGVYGPIAMPSAGTYTITATPASARLTPVTTTPTLTCTTNNLTLSAVAASGYHCCNCTEPLPTTLTLTDPAGSCTLTYCSGHNTWEGGHTVTVPGFTGSFTGGGAHLCTAGTVSTTIAYSLACGTLGGNFQLTKVYMFCQFDSSNLPDKIPAAGGILSPCDSGNNIIHITSTEGGGAGESISVSSPSLCSPLNFTATSAAGPAAGTITITE